MIDKKNNLTYLFFIFLSILYFANIYRVKLNSLEERISTIKEMLAYYKQGPSNFRGDKNFHITDKPLVLCGRVQQRKLVLVLNNLERLDVYDETEKMYFPESHQRKYIIKNGQLLIAGANDEVAIFNKAYFQEDDKTIYLVGPDIMLTNANCYRLP